MEKVDLDLINLPLDWFSILSWVDLDAECEVLKELSKEMEIYLGDWRSHGLGSLRTPRVLERFSVSSRAEVEDEVDVPGGE